MGIHTVADCSKDKDGVHLIYAKVVLYVTLQQVRELAIENSCLPTHAPVLAKTRPEELVKKTCSTFPLSACL